MTHTNCTRVQKPLAPARGAIFVNSSKAQLHMEEYEYHAHTL